MLSIITGSYLIFWGPLFAVTIWHWSWGWEEAKKSLAHEVCLHISYVHSIINPALYLVLHRGLRTAAASLLCCSPQPGSGLKSKIPSFEHFLLYKHVGSEKLAEACSL